MALAGIAVIMAGILCLCLSALVARTGSWWQGTLDAFGVGFVVGGVIDVLAIFGLNQFSTRETERRKKANQQALEILKRRMTDRSPRSSRELLLEQANDAEWLLYNLNDVDPELRNKLAKNIREHGIISGDLHDVAPEADS